MTYVKEIEITDFEVLLIIYMKSFPIYLSMRIMVWAVYYQWKNVPNLETGKILL